MVNWSSIAQRSTLGQLLRAPLAAIPKNAVVPILGGPNRGLLWRVGAADHGCWLGSYEFEKQRALWRARRPGSTVMDIGANVGFYTLLLSRAVGPTGQVVAIEPDRQNAARLRWHVQLNRLRNVHTLVGAVGAQAGTATFRTGATCTTGRVVADGDGTPVKSYRLDDLVFDGGLEIPALIKMDVEGGETDALAGAEHLLAARKTIWFVALHSQEIAAACLASFRRHRYDLTNLDGSAIAFDQESVLSEVIAIPRSE